MDFGSLYKINNKGKIYQWDIKIVEKNTSCFSLKNEMIFAEKLSFRARNSIFNLLDTTKAISEDEKKPLITKSKINHNI